MDQIDGKKTMDTELRSGKLPRIHRIQIITLSFLVMVGIVNFLDRSSLSIANTTIRSDLGLTGTQIGALLSAFSLAYGLAQLPAGLLLDRRGIRLILSAGMSLWSLAQMATGLVSNFVDFLSLRAILGMGEAPFMPAAVKAVNEWFPIQDRGKAMGIVNMSSTLGQALAPPLLTLIMIAFGWRNMFLIIGGLGIVLVLAWYPVNRDRNKTALTTEEQMYLNAGETLAHQTPISSLEWRYLFRLRTVWGMMLGFSGINYTAWLYLSWLPGYLQAERHLSVPKSAWVATVPFIAGTLGMLVNGIVADRLARRGDDLMRSRKLLIVVGMFCSAICTFLVTQAGSTPIAVLSISTALFFIHFSGTSAWGLVQVATPARMVASVSAIQNFASFLFASLAPILTGFLLDHTHSFNLALTICSCVTILGAFSYLFLVKDAITIHLET